METRRVLAAVIWDSGGDGINWTDPLNWSTDALPTSADDVTILIGGGTVKHAQGNDSIRSISCAKELLITGGSLTLTGGASTINGFQFKISPLATLTVSGPTTTLIVDTTATIDGANLLATNGGQLSLPYATAYAAAPSAITTIAASGAGSRIDLTAITSVTGTSGGINVQALSGGTIELDGLASTTARDLNFEVGGLGSTLNLGALKTASDSSRQSSLLIENGGTLLAPLWETYEGGAINVNAQGVTLPTFKNIDSSSLGVGAGGALSLPGVTGYGLATPAHASFRATGLASVLDLSSITSISGNTAGYLDVQAYGGAKIILDGLHNCSTYGVRFLASGMESTLQFQALALMTDLNKSCDLKVENGGTLVAPLLATYKAGTITAAATALTLTSLTNIDGSSLKVLGGGQLLLPNVTSYALGTDSWNVAFIASGAGSKLDLSPIRTLANTGFGQLRINALDGGTIEFDCLASTTARGVDFETDGAGSVLDLSDLTSCDEPSQDSSLLIENGGTLIAPNLTRYHGTIIVNNQSVSLPQLTNIDTSSLVAGANGVLTLPNITSYGRLNHVGTQFLAQGAGSRIELPGVTSMTSLPDLSNGLYVGAQAGGTVDLSGVVTSTCSWLDMQVDGAGSVLDLRSLTSAIDPMRESTLAIKNGGTLLAPLLTTYIGGSLSVVNHSVALPQLVNLEVSYQQSMPYSTFITVSGAGSRLDLSNVVSLSGSGSIYFLANAGGVLELDGLVSTTLRDLNLKASGAGSLILASALTSIVDANNQSSISVYDSGTVQLAPGPVTLSGVEVLLSGGAVAAGTLLLNGPSRLYYDGNVTGSLNNNAKVEPGNLYGRITINGDYLQAASGQLLMDLGGMTPRTQYDQLTVKGTVTLGGTLSIVRWFPPASGASFTIIDNDGSDPVVGTFANSPEGDVYTINGIPLRLSYDGGDGNDVTLTRIDNLVVDRKLFYDQSTFDGNIGGPSAADDAAIARDKVAYRPDGSLATFASVSSYSRGINGVMIDLAGPHGSITAADFLFRTGNNNNPGGWSAAPTSNGFSVRTTAGYRGADRIEITWPANSIANAWLEVQVLANANTGLPADDVFFWGNRVGDVGANSPAGQFLTSGADRSSVTNPANQGGPFGITNLRDFNRDGNVTSADATVVGNNQGTIERIQIPAAGPFAPGGGGGDGSGDGGIASALAATSTRASAAALPASVARRLENVDLNSGRIADFFHHLADQNTPGTRKLLVKIGAVADELGLEDELLDSILAELDLDYAVATATGP